MGQASRARLTGLHVPKTRRSFLFGFLGLVILILCSGSIPGAFTNIVADADTSIMEYYPDNNMGTVEYLAAGTLQNDLCPTNAANPAGRCRNRGLIYFDIANRIPAGSRIRRAWLQMWVRLIPPNDETDPFLDYGLHRVLIPWGEGTGTNEYVNNTKTLGRPALPGEASWNYAQYPSNMWSIPGGAPDFDYVATPSAITFISDEGGSPYDFGSYFDPALVSDVQLWLDKLGTNFGWMFMPTDEANRRWTAKRFDSRENPFDAFPILNVEFLPPPVLSVTVESNQSVRLAFDAEAEQAYRVEYRHSVEQTNWLTLTNIPASSEATNIVIYDDTGQAPTNRIYRAVAP